MYKTPKDITILGAGIMGLMTAYTLADDYNITIYDPKGFPANNASWMAGGMLAPYSEIEHMDMAWVKAGLKSIEIWEGLNLDTGFEQNGSLLVACPEDRHILERFKTHLPAELQTPQNVISIENQLDKKFETSLFLQEEAHLDPHKTMTALCDNLRKHKNVELINEATRSRDDEITVNCTGMAENNPDLRGVKGETVLIRNPEFRLSRPVRLMHPRYPLYIIPREDNVFMIGATIIESSNNENVSLRSAMELLSALYTLSPTFAEAEIVDIKAGIRPSYPDNLPRITIKDSTISANGLFRHGYLLAPVMAQCIRDQIAGRQNEFTPLFIKDNKNERNHQRAA